MSDKWHAWYSAEAEAVEMAGIECSMPIYLDAEGNHVKVTFVTREKELNYNCQWEDLQYKGEVFKWSNEN